jgi:hypothetical protein
VSLWYGLGVDILLTHAEWLGAAVALLALLAIVVIVINVHGHKLERHQERMRRLELSVGNLHKDRAAQHARSLQVPRPDAGPPTLSGAETVEVTADMLSTLRLDSKRKDEGS